ncbi:hypothetical protein GGI15_002307 [Coemansia interrupta]|uniref:6-pyruvoyltetrahydropterin synthase n=1 Tax=Coemansia interrupta TaxID=1126814 RepID=A0A9W8HLD0_9FUNG|nr:hypothetical protein GGI15_002307 [Coemansia interrupta]
MAPTAYVSRTEHFSAAHRLHSQHLSDEENRQLYGNCNHASGHGHNYVLETIFCGPIDPETGMVVNISDAKRWIKAAVLDVVDHRNLDVDIAFFKKRTSTIENLAVFIWARLLQHVPEELLFKIVVSETPKNKVEFSGDGLTAADIEECIL